MKAHSDDSGGYFMVRTKKQLKQLLSRYEIILRMCNHNLSVKKCNVSKHYFELLSVFYLYDTLLPMLPKFFYDFHIEPTTRGYALDIKIAYSKVLSLISNGATF